ncbi:aminotransferase class III-fold pyridoxal phosphate-dependent enzyme [Streptomyces sp. enrichment culture]|uniref:aminotransferase class III-fold pyridoxal phosphate-dependent enzyme n=1 Tax=Streptomyces sp. enrichment culture TaxID=1795815 RepID=UPI003F575439
MRHQPACEPTARTHARALPVVPVRARGLTVEGADGRRYLDCLSGAGALALGHNHPVVLEAIRDVLDSGAPLQVLDLATPVGDAFVTELLRTLPRGLAGHARVRFCGPAGAEALTAAVGLVRAATGRTGVVALTATCHEPSAVLPGACGVPAAHLPRPRHHHCPFGADGERGTERAARWAESVLDGREPGVPLPAGVVLEPVQAWDGAVAVPDTWTRRVRQVTTDRSIALIADESHTGVGRTGAFWAVEHSGITPDVMVLSQAVGGGLPLAVVVHRDDLDVPPPDTDRGAFRGNQLAMAAGAATLAHVRENRLDRHAAVLGTRMLARLRELAARFPCVGDVRGRGLMIGIEMTDPDPDAGAGTTAAQTPAPVPGGCARRPRPAAAVLADTLRRECLRRGLIVGPGAGHPGVVRLLPPLTITEEQAVAVLDRLADAVEAVARHHPGRVPGHPPCRRG